MSRCPECGEKTCCGASMSQELDADQAEIARLRALLREAEGPCHMVVGDLGKRIKAALEAKP